MKEPLPGNPILDRYREHQRMAAEEVKEGDEPSVVSDKVDLDRFVPGAVDPTTGMPLCPECGTVLGEKCPSCYHTRFADGSPFVDNGSVKKESK